MHGLHVLMSVVFRTHNSTRQTHSHICKAFDRDRRERTHITSASGKQIWSSTKRRLVVHRFSNWSGLCHIHDCIQFVCISPPDTIQCSTTFLNSGRLSNHINHEHMNFTKLPLIGRITIMNISGVWVLPRTKMQVCFISIVRILARSSVSVNRRGKGHDWLLRMIISRINDAVGSAFCWTSSLSLYFIMDITICTSQ